MIVLTIPYPPSVNHYWRAVPGHGVLISAAGRKYRSEVALTVATSGCGGVLPLLGRLAVDLVVTFPDRRKRDLDNLPKAILDACTHAGLWLDDSQIDDLRVRRIGVGKPGAVEVRVTHAVEVRVTHIEGAR